MGRSARDRQKRKHIPEEAAAETPPPSPPLIPPAWRRHALLLLALWLVALIAYSTSFRAGLIFDNGILLQDSRIKAATSENINLIFTQDYWYTYSLSGLYRPFTTLSYLFNYAILGNGNHPAGYHWVNFALHAVNIALVYALGLLLLGEIGQSCALAAVWALHPLLTESITNVIGRSDLLSAFGVLGGLLCHVKAAAARGRLKVAWLAGLLFAVTVGLYSKESTVVVLGVMLLYDLTFRTAASWRNRAPGYAVMALPWLTFFYVRDQVLSQFPAVHFPYGDNPLTGADFWTSRLTAIKVIGKYLWLLIWPRHLSPDYSYNQVPLVTWRFDNAEDWKALAALVVCLGAAAVAIRCYRRQKPVSFLIAFFFVTLSPTSNIAILIGTIMAERFLYLPSIGFAGCLVVAIYAISRRLPAAWQAPRRLAPAALGLIALAFAARTSARNLDWHDISSLFSKASPASYKTSLTLANAANDNTRPGLEKAIGEIQKALAIIDPLPDERNADAPYINAGAYYRQEGERVAPKDAEGAPVATPEAMAWYRKSLDTLLRAQRIQIASNALFRRDDLAHGRRISEYGWYELYLELSHTYLRLGQPRQALEAIEYGRRKRQAPDFWIDMAVAWRALGDNRRAATSLMEGLLVDTTYTRFAVVLAQLYKETEPKSCALQTAGGQTSVNLACPLVHEDLCAASRNVARFYGGLGQQPKAAQTARTAVADLGCPAEMFK